MNTKIVNRIGALRDAMHAAGISAVIIPQNDPHQSEYIASHWQTRRWLSGFTGSAGDLVVTADEALLWTDSRYFLQASTQLDGTDITLMKDGLPDTPSMEQWLCDNLKAGAVVGIDGLMFSHAATKKLRNALDHHGIRLTTDFNPIDKLWVDRPALPEGKAFAHDVKYAGEEAADKIARVLADVERQEAEATLVSDLAEIAWTLNIRANDVNCNPVVISFLYLDPAGSHLFIDPKKTDEALLKHLKDAGVDTAAYDAVESFLAQLPADKRVLVDEGKIVERLWDALGDRAVSGSSPVAMPKAVKNEVQVEGIRAAMQRDGVALVRAVMEIERRLAAHEPLTEIGVADILKAERSKMPLYFDLSFDTIAGYRDHGAIVHYSATEETDRPIQPDGLLLIDSGAQYLDGTTDITRTIALGVPTDIERSDFTLVMKGHIALGTAVFPEGTRGAQLDALARMPLWQHGLSYLHGTGHGVGHFLNVHEGPQSIRLNDVPTPLTPGMITSNEPGLYREGMHGIRCENLVLCREAWETEFGRFLMFETLTLFPFDRKLFNLDMLTPEERAWVDEYHQMVWERLSPSLNDEEKAWLRKRTLPL